MVAAHKSNIVVAPLVRKLQVKGKRGDSVKLPKPTRGDALAKASNAAVTTLVASGGASVTVNLTAHWYYARLIEDIAEVHALASMRRFYTDDAGYSLAVKKDVEVLKIADKFQGGGASANEYIAAFAAGDGSTTFTTATDNSSAITDAGIRRSIQRLDDNNIPMVDRFLVVPPVGRRIMMGLARFTEQAFVGDGKTIRNGKLGDVYGVSVHVSTNCQSPASGATTVKIGVLAQKDAIVLAEVLGPRVQTQYQAEHLATLLVADTIFGVEEAYDLGGVALAMPGA